MTRALHILWRVGEMLVSVASRFFNAAVLGGSTYQTTSARAHIEPDWRAARRVINAAFFWQDDHCALAWERELHHARKAIEKAMEVRT